MFKMSEELKQAYAAFEKECDEAKVAVDTLNDQVDALQDQMHKIVDGCRDKSKVFWASAASELGLVLTEKSYSVIEKDGESFVKDAPRLTIQDGVNDVLRKLGAALVGAADADEAAK